MFVNQYAVCVAQSTSPHPENASTDIRYPISSGRRRGLRVRAPRERSPSVNVDGVLELNDCHQQGQPEPSAHGGRFKSRGKIQNQRAVAGVVPRPGYVSDPVRDPGPVLCPGRGLNPGVAPDHVPAPVPVSDPVSDLARERLTAPSTRPDPSPRADCGHIRGVQLSGAVHDTEDQSRGKSNLTWADRVRSNDGKQPMQCDPSPEHARDTDDTTIEKGKCRA
ncbi:hypothetical protein HPB51_002932 [Rhipicephalus microplus]|uniref:Uncharacterized protein n=1 Tax=Rhipicephalus microplus TaxID=6941 RepID=A0A9J6DSV9_RHIMP|nr:hypothetical protein HPB51_002932 [Rhipicephalus microplus]